MISRNALSFSEKKVSRNAVITLIMGIVELVGFVILMLISILSRGNMGIAGGLVGCLLVILAFAATPVSGKLFRKLPERVQGAITPVLVLASLVLCTASLVDASYNPFLYFRF